MKKLAFILFPLMALFMGSCQTHDVHITTAQGELVLTPLSDNAVRVRLTTDADSLPQLEELIYTEKVHRPAFRVQRSGDDVTLKMKNMRVVYSGSSQLLTFYDAEGNVLLSEADHSVTPAVADGTPCLDVTAAFHSPTDEHLFGTGQFQDGYLDIRGLTRRLTQVNTQISIPFILSNKRYGLLWNNYGLTDFNPSDSCLTLHYTLIEGDTQTVDATSTTGNRRETRQFGYFEGTFTASEEGDYALLLDVGQSMARRHWLMIDSTLVMDAANTWLPPTSSAIVRLTAGEHHVSVQGVQGDNPTMGWRKVTTTTTFHSPVSTALDYTVFAGSADEVIATYRRLTGPVPTMPDWMFGYIHCRERYHSSQEIIDNMHGFLDRHIPLDVIVQDWLWWGKYGWNALRFDEEHYPDPSALTDTLHANDVCLMLSVWSKVTSNSPLGRELKEKGYFIPGTEWVDFFNPAAAQEYAQHFCDSLDRYGIDAWWFDATEPENDDLHGRRVAANTLPGDFYRNVYPLMVNRTMYNMLKKNHDKGTEPVILTRSAFAGMQRYGVVTWSGDVGNDYETLRRQIVGGLGQMAAGLPWWTYDAGGFFRPWNQYTDEAYQERLVRWVQTATFLPFMRIHGYMSNTEPWRYAPQTEALITRYIQLRKELQPYVVECARRVSKKGYTLMRPLLFDFPDDDEALRQDCEYMFGPDYLVYPVIETGVATKRIYLPANEGGWTDFFTHIHYQGGQYIDYPLTLETIPVFIKEKP